MTPWKTVALITGVLLIGKIGLTVLPGHITGRDAASLLWVIALVITPVLALWAARLAGRIDQAQTAKAAVYAVALTFTAGAFIHGWDSVGDLGRDVGGSLLMTLLIWVGLTYYTLPITTDIMFGRWSEPDGTLTKFTWNPHSGRMFVRRPEQADVVLTVEKHPTAALLKSYLFTLHPNPDEALHRRIEQAFQAHPLTVPTVAPKFWPSFALGVVGVAGLTAVLLWVVLGAMSVIIGLIIYLVLGHVLRRWLLGYSQTGFKALDTTPNPLPTQTAYDQSHHFFSTKPWLAWLYPLTLIDPVEQAQYDLFNIGVSYMYWGQRDKAVQMFERAHATYPDYFAADWLLKVIRDIQRGASA